MLRRVAPLALGPRIASQTRVHLVGASAPLVTSSSVAGPTAPIGVSMATAMRTIASSTLWLLRSRGDKGPTKGADVEEVREELVNALGSTKDDESRALRYLQRSFEHDEARFTTLIDFATFPYDAHARKKFAEAFKKLRPKSTGPIDVEWLLNECLNNKLRSSNFVPCDRDEALRQLQREVPSPGQIVPLAGEKRNLVVAAAMRGAGKTTLLKHWVGTKQRRLCAVGRVLVLESSQNWFDEITQDFVGRRDGEKGFLVALIERHLQKLGCADLRDAAGALPKTVEDAYAKWTKITAKAFGLEPKEIDDPAMRPLIVIDTCEVFADKHHRTLRHTAADGHDLEYNLLEAIAVAVPSNHFVVAFGTLATVNRTRLFQTHVNVCRLSQNALGPLPLEAALTWYEASDHNFREFGVEIHKPTFRILHALTAGVPRLLEYAVTKTHTSLAVMPNHFVPLLVQRCFGAVEKYYGSLHNPTECPPNMLIAATMASLVKWDDWPLHVPSMDGTAATTFTLETAVAMALGAEAGPRLTVPPVFAEALEDTDVKKITGMPLELRSIACPLVPSKFHGTGKPATMRGQPFEKLAVHALLCRYVLARWKRRSFAKQPDWVPLGELLRSPELEAAKVSRPLEALLDAWEVNLSGGMYGGEDTSASVTAVADSSFAAFEKRGKYELHWNSANQSAHHDAYLWGRKKVGGGRSTKAHVIAVQMRHGAAKTGLELKDTKRRFKSKRAGAGRVPFLLSLRGGSPGDAVVVSERTKFGVKNHQSGAEDTFLEVNAESLCDTAMVWAKDILSPGAAAMFR